MDVSIDIRVVGWFTKHGRKHLLAYNGTKLFTTGEFVDELISAAANEGNRFPEYVAKADGSMVKVPMVTEV